MIVGALTGHARHRRAAPRATSPTPRSSRGPTRPRASAAAWARVTADPREAVAGARALYTDTWVSMGDEESRDERLARVRRRTASTTP